MMNFYNSYPTNGKITMVTTIITAMAAYSNERVAAIVISVLYRMLTLDEDYIHLSGTSWELPRFSR